MGAREHSVLSVRLVYTVYVSYILCRWVLRNVERSSVSAYLRIPAYCPSLSRHTYQNATKTPMNGMEFCLFCLYIYVWRRSLVVCRVDIDEGAVLYSGDTQFLPLPDHSHSHTNSNNNSNSNNHNRKIQKCTPPRSRSLFSW
jgi:hypothetical protein